MLHFCFGLFFLLLTLVLTSLYLCTFAFLVLLAKGLVHVYRQWRDVPLYGAWRDAAGEVLEDMVRFFRSRRFAKMLMGLALFHCCLYIQQRVEWMGKDNGNYSAKEYWVAGQCVYMWRTLWAHLGGHPEALIMQPLTALQGWIYRQGYPCLPEQDGERGIWTDLWFVYPYSRNMLLPKDNNDLRTSVATSSLLLRSWQAMEQQATGVYADREMEQLFYRNFPGEAFFYMTYFPLLTGRAWGSDVIYLQNASLMDKLKKLRQWLHQVHYQWKSSPDMARFIRNHPKIEAMSLLTIQVLSSNLLSHNIYNRTFSCTDSDVHEYIDARNAFVGDDKHCGSWKRMGNEQGLRLYSIGVNIPQNRFSRYILKRFCDKEVLGKENDSRFQVTLTDNVEEQKEEYLHSLFLDEILILEDLFPDRHSSKVGTAYKKAAAEVKESRERERRKWADWLKEYRQKQQVKGEK